MIAKLDLVEGDDGVVTPVDYKHGRPRERRAAWSCGPPTACSLACRLDPAGERVSLRGRRRLLREDAAAGARRVRRRADAETEEAIARAWETAAAGEIPPPLVDSPKCVGCSLVGICLPDETSAYAGARIRGTGANSSLCSIPTARRHRENRYGRNQVRRLMTPRDELRPVYLNTQGLRVGKSGEVLQVREKDKLLQEVRIGEICQVNLMGNVQITTQAVQTLCEAGVPICYFSQGGWFYGITRGLNTKNVFLRKSQFRLAEEGWFALSLARQLVAGKIRNQRTMLQRNHVEPRAESLTGLKQMIERAERAAVWRNCWGSRAMRRGCISGISRG